MPEISNNGQASKEENGNHKRYHIPSLPLQKASRLGDTRLGAEYIQNLKDIQKKK